MAQGGGDELISTTDYDHQWKMPQMERRGGRNVHGMVSGAYQAVSRVPRAVAHVPKAVYHGLEHVGRELKEASLGGGKKPTEEDFVSTCLKVDERLSELNDTYAIFSGCKNEVLETRRQLNEKQILISVVGHLNTGKSTLLNALLGARLLPMKKEAATGIKVRIHHVPGNSYPKAKAASDQHPKLIVKKGKQVPPEEVVGATEIYKRLETLNEEIRSGAEVLEEDV